LTCCGSPVVRRAANDLSIRNMQGAAPHGINREKEAYGRSVSGDHSRVARPVSKAAAGASA
jgi:hypothetical protein